MTSVALISKKRRYSKETEKSATFREVMKGLWNNLWALMFPVILIVGIRFGIFTAQS
jgi:TRAP-type C4-dicarboxylate transport system permease large subunit